MSGQAREMPEHVIRLIILLVMVHYETSLHPSGMLFRLYLRILRQGGDETKQGLAKSVWEICGDDSDGSFRPQATAEKESEKCMLVKVH